MNELTLSISNLDQLQHGIKSSHQFDVKGGTLGSQGADWQLMDRQQRIRPVHCEIRWLENSFCAIDRCGQTFLNDSLVSLGRLAPVRLKQGDCLRIGGYRLMVGYHQDQSPHHSNRCALEALFDPTNRLLDALVADLPAGMPWAQSDEQHPHAVIDINHALGASVSCDPLVALGLVHASDPAPDDPLRALIRGERP